MKKYLSILVLIAMFGVNDVCAQPLASSRELLRSAQDKNSTTAQHLLKAIDSGSIEEIRTHIKVLIANNAAYLVLPLLFDPDDAVIAEAAKSLAHQKSRKVADLLIRSLNELNVSITGSTQAIKLRAEAKLAVQESLVDITGVRPSDGWNDSKKIQFFSNAVRDIHEP